MILEYLLHNPEQMYGKEFALSADGFQGKMPHAMVPRAYLTIFSLIIVNSPVTSELVQILICQIFQFHCDS